jgi:hypothetical protein
LSFVFSLPVNAYVKPENVQRGVQKAHSHSPLFWRAGDYESAFFSLMLHQNIIYASDVAAGSHLYIYTLMIFRKMTFLLDNT